MVASDIYTYNAKCIRVIDGDSCVLNIDLGFKIWLKRSSRLTMINTPELNSPDEEIRLKAVAAKDALAGLIEGKDVRIKSHRLDKYGRPEVEIVVMTPGGDGIHVNQRMIDDGHAVPYVS